MGYHNVSNLCVVRLYAASGPVQLRASASPLAGRGGSAAGGGGGGGGATGPQHTVGSELRGAVGDGA